MPDVLDRKAFQTMYGNVAPWDIGAPQEPFLVVAPRIVGSILDAGCGTGDTALFFAERGHEVTGIDFLDEPIRRAKQKALERGLTATFLVKDALTLEDWTARFDNVIDSGLFHVFSDADQRKYVDGLAKVLKPGGLVSLMCWSDEEPGTDGPRRVSKKELQDAFGQQWVIESIQPCSIKARPTRADLENMPYRLKGWFALVVRGGTTDPGSALRRPSGS
jgi:SAM-dependent methyltransferase